MKRKLFSTALCAFALLLLMGAGVVSQHPSAVLAEEECFIQTGAALAHDTQPLYGMSAAIPAVAGPDPLKLAQNRRDDLLIDGESAPADIVMNRQNGVSYVSLAPMAKVLDETTAVSWDAGTQTAVLKTEKLELTAKVGQLYLIANGRYLYLPDRVQLTDGQVMVPLWALAQAYDASVGWEASTGTATVTRGSGAILPGDEYYDSNTLFWLSRVITAESGNQVLEGQMGVGIVVMNRVKNPHYPDTVEGVLAQKNQFSTYRSGRLAEREPRQSSVIAAKLVLDGGMVSGLEDALYFDSAVNSWASRHKECIAVIEDHKFYH